MTGEPRVEHRQRAHRVRLEWGVHGVGLLAAECAVVVIVDVLSFCTSVDVVVSRGGSVLPQRMSGGPLPRGAVAAGPRDGGGPSLRPSSLVALAPDTLIALPSPNGATLCAAAAGHDAVVLAGCLRNAPAVAAAALAVGGPIGLVAAGERWPDGTLRVAVEDALGAGAIAAHLPGAPPRQTWPSPSSERCRRTCARRWARCRRATSRRPTATAPTSTSRRPTR